MKSRLVGHRTLESGVVARFWYTCANFELIIVVICIIFRCLHIKIAANLLLLSSSMSSVGCFYNLTLPLPTLSKESKISSFLYNGSKFNGTQKSKGSSYDVEVTILTVSPESHSLCGQLRISGPTAADLAMTTYFEGEMISRRHSFLTRKWEADEDVDRRHWGKFSAFAEHLQSAFEADNMDYAALDDFDFVFMRWKERFPTDRCTNSVSFAGFYYICFQKSSGHIDGYYYHRGSEMFQTLSLKHVGLSSSGIYEPM